MRLIASFLIIFIATEITAAQSNTSSVFRFLEITPTARSAGMGGNHVGLYNGDFSLMHINPAFLNGNSLGSVSGSYINFLADANMGFTSGAYKFENIGMFGAGICFVSYGEFDQLNSWDLRTFGETEKPKILDNLIRHVLLGGEAKIAEVVHLRLGEGRYLHEQTKTNQIFDLAGVAFWIGFESEKYHI